MIAAFPLRYTLFGLMPLADIKRRAPTVTSALWAKARGEHWIARNTFSPYGRAIALLVKLWASHSCFANDVVELAIGQISPMRVWKLDQFAVVDPVVAVMTVMVLYPCKVALYKVVVDFRDRCNIRPQDAISSFDPINPVDRAAFEP